MTQSFHRGWVIDHYGGMSKKRGPRDRAGKPVERPAKQTVMVGWITGGHPARDFTKSLSELMLTSNVGAGGHITAVSMVAGSPRPAENRTLLVNEFLGRTEDWLLMLDDDMTFDTSVVDRMMEFADPDMVPVLGGLAFVGAPGQIKGPTLYVKEPDSTGFPGARMLTDFPSKQAPRGVLVKVFGTGGACLLVHRNVFIRCAEAYAKLPSGHRNPYPWFTEGIVSPEGVPVGEDIAFCMRLEPLGIPIHVHTGIEFGHAKVSDLTYQGWREQQNGNR